MASLGDLLREMLIARTGSATADGMPRLQSHEDAYVNSIDPFPLPAYQADVRRMEPPGSTWANGQPRQAWQEDDYANSGLVQPKPIPAYPMGPGFDPMANEIERMQGAVGRNRIDPTLAPVRAALQQIMSPMRKQLVEQFGEETFAPDRNLSVSMPGRPAMQPAPREELQPNSFRNERTGKVTYLSSTPEPVADVLPKGYSIQNGYDGPGAQVVQSMRQPNGTILQVIRKPIINGAGQQSMATEFRTLVSDAVDPIKIAESRRAYEAAQTAALTPAGRQAAALAEARGKAQAERETLAGMTPAQQQARAAQVWGVKVQPGESVDPETGSVFARPGGAAWQKQQKELQEAEEQRRTTVSHADAVLNNINKLIGTREAPKRHEGYRGATGMIDAAMPGFTPAQTNARKIQEALLNQLSVEGLQSIRQAGTAPGSITEKEWPIFQQLFNTLSYAQDEPAYQKALEEARTRLEEVKANTDRNYKAVEAKISGAAVPVKSEDEARKLPSGTWFVTPDGQRRRRN